MTRGSEAQSKYVIINDGPPGSDFSMFRFGAFSRVSFETVFSPD